MACINASGELSEAARQILTAMLAPAALSQVAAQTGLPLYRIRSAMRELSAAGYAVEMQQDWQTTEIGRHALQVRPARA